MVTFLVDAKNRPLYPTRKSDMIRRWLRTGKAKVLKGGLRKGEPILVQVFKQLKPLVDSKVEFRIGIDPGYSHVGYSILKIDTSKKTIVKLMSGEVELRTKDVTENMSKRKMYRQIRRYFRRKNVKKRFVTAKFRHPIWKNRRKHPFQPTHNHLIQSHLNLLKFIFDRIPYDKAKIHMEYASFDIHKAINPLVCGFE